jgi:hypothetical protein
MLIRNNGNFVEILLVERIPETLPAAGDLHLHVRVAVNAFCGENDKIWVEATAFHDFLSELQALEERRQGSATLASISPGELRLEIHSTDRAGHIGVTGQLGRGCYPGEGGTSWCHVGFNFALSCPSLLPQMLAEFRAMATSA